MYLWIFKNNIIAKKNDIISKSHRRRGILERFDCGSRPIGEELKIPFPL
jgi:hypothetical protein